MKKLIIALILLASPLYAECWKVSATIKLGIISNSKAEVVETYLNDDNSDMVGIKVGKANAELSSIIRDGKELTVVLFYDTKAKAQAIYDYLVAQEGDMHDLSDGAKSRVVLIWTNNDETRRRKGSKCLSTFIKQ